MPRGASRTAEMVAAVRAIYHHGPEVALFDDPFARFMLGPKFRLLCEVPFLRNRFLRDGLFRRLKSSLTVLSRARYAEDRLRAATRNGVDQYVVLGAGFDTFSLKAAEYDPDLRVFEVDTADSQKLKRKRLNACSCGLELQTRFVSVDFTKEAVGDRLEAEGFSATEPAFVSWLGVVIYLDEASVRATLESLARVCAPDSILVLDFMDARLWDDVFLEDKPSLRADVRRLMAYTATRGEPILSGFTVESMAGLAAKTGWQLAHSVTSRDHARKFLDEEPDHRWPTDYDHLVTLRRAR